MDRTMPAADASPARVARTTSRGSPGTTRRPPALPCSPQPQLYLPAHPWTTLPAATCPLEVLHLAWSLRGVDVHPLTYARGRAPVLDLLRSAHDQLGVGLSHA